MGLRFWARICYCCVEIYFTNNETEHERVFVCVCLTLCHTFGTFALRRISTHKYARSHAGSRKKLAIHTYTIHSSCSYSGSLRSKLVFSNEFFSLSHQSCRHRHHNLFLQRCCCRHLYYRHLAHIQSHESKATLFFKCFEAHDLSPVKPSAMIKNSFNPLKWVFSGRNRSKAFDRYFALDIFHSFPKDNTERSKIPSRCDWDHELHENMSIRWAWTAFANFCWVFPQRSAHQIEIDNNESNWDWIVDWFDSNAQCQVNNCVAFALPLPFCVGVAVVVDVWISFYIYFGLICRLWRCSLKNPVSIKCVWLGGEIPNFLLQLNIERKIFNFRRSTNKHRHRHTDIHTPKSCDFFLFFRPSNMVIMFEWPDAVQMNDKNKPTGNAK